MFLFRNVNQQWLPILTKAIAVVEPNYLQNLLNSDENWLPGKDRLFAAFSIPLTDLNYILLGESPYPRPQSANGFAFWDNAVHEIWSPNGFSKAVNRATSLRNFFKMLLVANGELKEDYSKSAIAALDKSTYCKTAEEFFHSLLVHGFLLLNASLVYNKKNLKFHMRNWQPFILIVLKELLRFNPKIKLLLFGKFAAQFAACTPGSCIIAPHPYNLSFITNSKVQEFFKPLNLLRQDGHE